MPAIVLSRAGATLNHASFPFGAAESGLRLLKHRPLDRGLLGSTEHPPVGRWLACCEHGLVNVIGKHPAANCERSGCRRAGFALAGILAAEPLPSPHKGSQLRDMLLAVAQRSVSHSCQRLEEAVSTPALPTPPWPEPRSETGGSLPPLAIVRALLRMDITFVLHSAYALRAESALQSYARRWLGFAFSDARGCLASVITSPRGGELTLRPHSVLKPDVVRFALPKKLADDVNVRAGTLLVSRALQSVAIVVATSAEPPAVQCLVCSFGLLGVMPPRAVNDTGTVDVLRRPATSWVLAGSIDLIFSRVSALIGLRSIHPPLLEALLCDPARVLNDSHDACHRDPWRQPWRSTPAAPLCDRAATLTASQAAALSLNCSIELIQGPPGTGKSATIVSIIQRSLRDGVRALIVAPSNQAVDAITSKLESFRYTDVLAVGAAASMGPATLRHTLVSRLTTHPALLHAGDALG